MEGYSQLGLDPKDPPFEVFAQGLGLFMTRKNAWLGFNEDQSGFGGEECYIHEKYRRQGRKTMCLPFLKWVHRFSRPDGVKYSVSTEQKLRNYVNEFKELDLDPKPLKNHFVGELGVDEGFFDQLWGGLIPKLVSEDDLESKIELLQQELAKLKSKKCCSKNK